jgi:hypothetical protein
MNLTGFRKAFILFLILIAGVPGFQGRSKNDDLIRSKSTLQLILKLFDAGYDNLFYETYPYKPGNKVTYLSGDDTVTGQRVAYLWPTSGVFSAVNALYNAMAKHQVSYLLEEKFWT